MYFNQQMPPWLWPPMGPTSTAPPVDPTTQITQWISGLETLKKALKEEKKDTPKKPDGSLIGMMLFMILISPITGPLVFWCFSNNPLVHR